MNEELLHEIIQMQRAAEEAESNLKFVNQQIEELKTFKEGLKSLKVEGGEEILASIGKGVYTKAKREKSDLYIEVGAGVVVKKSAAQTIDVLNEQIARFTEARMQLLEQIQQYRSGFNELYSSIVGKK